MFPARRLSHPRADLAQPPVRRVIVSGTPRPGRPSAAEVLAGLDPVLAHPVRQATLALAGRRAEPGSRIWLELWDGRGERCDVTAWPKSSDTWGLAFVASWGRAPSWPSIVAWTVRFGDDEARIEAIAVSDAGSVVRDALDAWDAVARADALPEGPVGASARLDIDPLGWEIRIMITADPGDGAARKLERRLAGLLLPVRVSLTAADDRWH